MRGGKARAGTLCELRSRNTHAAVRPNAAEAEAVVFMYTRTVWNEKCQNVIARTKVEYELVLQKW